MKKSISKTTITASFLVVPFLASLISMWHVYKFFGLGDPNWMSAVLSFTLEMASLASFISLSVLDKIKKGIIYFIFVLLLVTQLVGNVYAVFDYVNQMLAADPNWLASFVELLTPLFGKVDPATYKFALSLFIGIPIPLISLSFLKSLVDYLEVSNNETPNAEVKSEEVKMEEKEASSNAPILDANNFNVEIKKDEVKKEPDKKDEHPEGWVDPHDAHLAANPFE